MQRVHPHRWIGWSAIVVSKHSRFKPGQSGNPSGRRKGARSLKTLRRELYLEPVEVRHGDKIKRVPKALAVDMMLINRAFKGHSKSIELAHKMADELGVYDEAFPMETGYPMNLTKAQVATLSDEDLETMLEIVKKAHGQFGPS